MTRLIRDMGRFLQVLRDPPAAPTAGASGRSCSYLTPALHRLSHRAQVGGTGAQQTMAPGISPGAIVFEGRQETSLVTARIARRVVVAVGHAVAVAVAIVAVRHAIMVLVA